MKAIQAILLFLLLQSLCSAQITTNWTGQTSDKFTENGNWNNGAPQSGDTAQFNLNASFDVFLNADVDIFNLRLFGGAEILMFGQNELATDFVEIFEDSELILEDRTGVVTTGGIFVGNFQDGDMQVRGGSVFKSTNNFQNVIGKEPGVSGNVNVSGSDSVWQTGNLIVGEEGNGTIAATAGGAIFTMNDATVGRFTTSNGSATLKTGSAWEVGENLVIADGLNSTGTVVVDGDQAVLDTGDADTDVFTIGHNGSGDLSISSQGQVNSWNVVVGQMFAGDGHAVVESSGQWNIISSLILGDEADSQGMVTLTGAGSQINIPNQDIIIGDEGMGNFQVLNNSSLVSGEIYVAKGLNSTGSMLVDNADVNCERLRAGGVGAGSIEIRNGANVVSAFSINVLEGYTIHVENGSTLSGLFMYVPYLGGVGPELAEVVIDNSLLDISQLELGDYGEGQMSLSNSTLCASANAVVESGSGLTIRNSVVEASNLTVRGEVYADLGSAEIDADVLVFPSGLIRITSPAPVTFLQELDVRGELAIVGNSEAIVHGEWTGDGQFTGTGHLCLKGPIRPFNNTEIISIQPNVTMDSTSTLEIEIGGAALEDHDVLKLSGDLNINNAGLSVEFTDGFQPTVGQVFILADVVGTLNGQFEGYPEGAVVASTTGVDLIISYEDIAPNTVSLKAFEADPLYGDVNLDGNVDLLDVAAFVDRIAMGPFQVEADCDMNGELNLLDVAPFVDILSGN